MVAGAHVCRRCLWLWPLALVVLVVAAAAGLPGTLERVLLVALPLPAVVEFVLEHLGRLTYDPRRQVAVTVGLGVGLGAGLARYVEHPSDPVWWVTVAAYTAVCTGALVVSWRRP